jgi:hypothetical protein
VSPIKKLCSGEERGSSPVVSLKTCDRSDFSNPSASSLQDEAFFCFGFEEVKDLFRLKGGEADLQV